MAPTLYALRRRRGQCVQCGHTAQHATYCDDCRQRRNTLKRQQYAWRTRHHGPNTLFCCGRQHPITQIPFRTLCCGRVFGLLEESS